MQRRHSEECSDGWKEIQSSQFPFLNMWNLNMFLLLWKEEFNPHFYHWWQFCFCLQRLRMKTCFILCNSEIFCGRKQFSCFIKSAFSSWTGLPSTHILNKCRQESRAFWTRGWLLLRPVQTGLYLPCRPSGRSQLPSGQWVKLGGIVRMPYVAATWTVTGDWTVQRPVGEANQHWRKVYLPTGAADTPSANMMHL